MGSNVCMALPCHKQIVCCTPLSMSKLFSPACQSPQPCIVCHRPAAPPGCTAPWTHRRSCAADGAPDVTSNMPCSLRISDQSIEGIDEQPLLRQWHGFSRHPGTGWVCCHVCFGARRVLPVTRARPLQTAAHAVLSDGRALPSTVKHQLVATSGADLQLCEIQLWSTALNTMSVGSPQHSAHLQPVTSRERAMYASFRAVLYLISTHSTKDCLCPSKRWEMAPWTRVFCSRALKSAPQ